MASTKSPAVPLDELFSEEYLIVTILEPTADMIVTLILVTASKVCEEIANPSTPRQHVPLDELVTAKHPVSTIGTAAADLVFYVPRKWYKWVTRPCPRSRQVPLNELASPKYLFSAIGASLPKSVTYVPREVYQHITKLPTPTPRKILNSVQQLFPVHLITTIGSTTLDILVFVPRKFYERLTKSSEVELALKETCSSMLVHSMAIHGGSGILSTQYSEDSSTVVGDTPHERKPSAP